MDQPVSSKGGRACQPPWCSVLICSLAFAFIPAAVASRVWVHSVIPADHEAEALLPHFVNYYHQLGISYKRFLFIVHHDPSRHDQAGLAQVTGICQGYSIECEVWQGNADPNTRLEKQLQMLKNFVDDPIDWIIVAEIDELQEWKVSLRSAFSYSFISNSSVILGEVVDRAAVGGAVVAVHGFSSEQPPRSLAKQYPLRCSSGMLFGGTTLTAGPASKVVAFQAYLRLFRHGRHVVPPDEAQMYFARCFPGRPCPRLKVSQSESSISTPSDLYNLTPYAWFEDRYRYENTPQQAATAAGHEFNIPLWEIVESDVIVPIHKFRWRAGALVANEEWLDRYRGTCSVHKPNEPDCRPLLPRWREAAASHLRVKQQGIIDPVTWNCSAEVDGTQDSIDTTYMGLAWEEFDSRLSVTSKIRNLAKGDSQARNAAKMDADYDASSSEKKDQAS